jgi:inward rectifier potassium channel
VSHPADRARGVSEAPDGEAATRARDHERDARPSGSEDAAPVHARKGGAADASAPSRDRVRNLDVFDADGRLRIVPVGLHRQRRKDLYYTMLAASWPLLLGFMAAAFLVTNVLFALAYLALGDGAIDNARPGSFADLFFFSVQTMATIGYGKLVPQTIAANLLVSAEAFFGLVAFGVVAGLAFTKFARPTARVLFGKVAVVAKRDGVRSLMFRLVNERGEAVIVEAQAHVVMVRDEHTLEGEAVRRFYDLDLVHRQNAAFALSWTVVHPLTPASPIYNCTPESLRASDTIFIISVTGFDEAFAQTVHTRHVYAAREVLWGKRFADILSKGEDGLRRIDYRRFHDVVPEQ